MILLNGCTMMKILWLTNIPSPYRVDFFNLLGEKSDLTVLFEKVTATDRDNKWTASSFKSFRGIILKGIRAGTDNAFCPGAIKWIIRREYDIIVVSNYSTPTGMAAIQLLKIRKIPFIIEVDGGFAKDGRGIKEGIKKQLIGAAAYWLSSGEKTSEYLIAYGAKKDRIFWYPFTSINQHHIISNVLTTDNKLQLRNELNIVGDRIAVAVGRFIHCKGFDTLINAWARINSNDMLLIIGGGGLKDEYTEQIKRLALNNIRLIEFKQRDELLKYYKAADLFILPTLGDVWGLVLNEAMACGLPVITTDKCIAGLELVEDNKNGFIVRAGEETELAEKIKYVMSNENVLRKMSDNSLERIGQYTLENMVETHIKIFKNIGEKL